MINWWGYSDRLKKRDLRYGSGSKKGVLGTGQARKWGGGLNCSTYLYWAIHAYECPLPGGETMIDPSNKGYY